ncbi:TrlF family AAA-like ATPase [Mycolicibacterium sp. XJ2]
MSKTPAATLNEQVSARWVRAALQINPYSYIGQSAPSTSFADEAAYNTAILDRCELLGIEIIGITDHWRVDSAAGLIAAAEARGMTALPGFEANTAEGYHLLVLLESGTELGKVNAAIGACGASPGSANGTTGKPFAEILAELEPFKALVIPAHVNVANAGMLTGRRGSPLENAIRNPALHALAISPNEPEAQDQRDILANRKPFDRAHKLAMVYSDDVCHPDKLAELGSSCWFKVSRPRLSSLLHAVRTPQTRIRHSDPSSTPRVAIRSISWTGGFLDGATISFSDDLTTLIGGRGTGKSTVIESLRYALDIPPIGDAAQRDHDAIVADVLEAGTIVELVVDAVTPEHAPYTIQRTVPSAPVVLDTAGTVTEMDPADVVGDIEIFSQHELAEVAQQPTNVAQMIQRFSGAPSSNDLVEIQQQLAENRANLRKVERDQTKLEETLSAIPRLQAAAKHFEKTNWASQLSEQQRLAKDQSVLTQGAKRVSDASEAVEDFAAEDITAPLRRAFANLDQSPQRPMLDGVPTATSQLADAIDAAIQTVRTAVATAHTQIEGIRTAWTTATEPQRARHAKVIRELKAEGHDPDKFIAVTNDLNELQDKAARRDVLSGRRDSLLKERRTMLEDLYNAETSERRRLGAAVRQANKATVGVVLAKPIVSPNRSPFIAAVNKHVKNARHALLEVVESNDFSPREFVAAVRAGAQQAEAKFGLKGAQWAAIDAAGEDFLRELEEHVVGYAVEVSLDVAAEGSGARQYRTLGSLSKGQRATALLLLLLGVSQRPLIIDQPEDDLDNRFVYTGLVTKLRLLKGIRQVIVSTHNANVPVLGDAELIVTLEGDGDHGWPVEEKTGSLDKSQVRAVAEDILEGGHTAFDTRMYLYGF